MNNFEQIPKTAEEIEEINTERARVDKLRESDYGRVDSVKKIAKRENEFRDILPKGEVEGLDKDRVTNFFSDEVIEKIKNEKEKFVDPLTGVDNRGAMNDMVPHILDMERRDGKQSSVLMLDIDKFSLVNNTYGHDVGDRVLKEIVNVVQETIRKSDFTFRYGGEEFVIFLGNTNMGQSEELAERIRENIEKLKIVHEEETIDPTVSIGCMSTSELEKWLTKFKGEVKAKSESKDKNMREVMDDLIKKADTAMYYSKGHINQETGKDRNQVTIYTEEVDQWVKNRKIEDGIK
jgi:diguanylate cyclase (GGDEF)-like protein